MTTANYSAEAIEILELLVEHFGVGDIEELPYVHPRPEVFDFQVDEVTVRLGFDDGVANVYVFGGGRSMMLRWRAQLTWAPASVVAGLIAAELDAAIAAEFAAN